MYFLHKILLFERGKIENYKIFTINTINVKDAKVHSNKYNLNIKMTSLYNKLCNKQHGIFYLLGYICIKNKDHQMNSKRHKNHLISSNHAYFMVAFSSSILFCNANNNFKVFHKMQGYFRFI
jgi:hypothetical protein